MFFKHFIRILGCLFVMAAMGLLVWLPTTPWATLTVSAPLTTSTITLSVTGYDSFIIADSAVGLAQFVARINEAGGAGEVGQSIFGAQTAIRLPEPLQSELDKWAQTMWLFVGVQVTLVVLPLLTTFMAFVVLFSSSSMTWQMMRGMALLLLTVVTLVLMVGGFIYLSRLFDQAQPELQANLQVGLLSVELRNTMNWRLAAAAGIGGLFGAMAALLGAALTAKSPADAMPLYAMNAPTLPEEASAANPPARVLNTPSEPIAPTVRLPHAKAAAARPTPAQAKRCPNCGAEHNVSARFCNKCGQALIS